MKRPSRKFLTPLRITLGIGLLYYVLSTTGGWRVAKQFISTPWLLPGVAVLAFVGAAIESQRLALLFKSQGTRLSFTHGYRLVAIGTFFNFVIPGGTGGDAMKLYYLASENRGRVVEMTTVLIVDRAVSLFSLLLFVVASALVERELLINHVLIRWLVGLAALGIIGLLAMAVISCSVRFREGKLYAYFMNNVPARGLLQRIADALYTFRRHKTALWFAVLLSLLGHLILAVMFLAVKKVVMPDTTVLVTCVLALLGMLANALPVTPGGLGVGEVAFDQLFSMAGFPGGAALMLAWRASMLPLCLVGCLLYVGGSKRGAWLTQHESDSILVASSARHDAVETVSHEKV